MEEIIKNKKNEKDKKINAFLTLFVLVAIVVLFIKFGGKPNSCDCIDNLSENIGPYYLLSDKDKKFRDECNKAWAGRATMWLDCNKK